MPGAKPFRLLHLREAQDGLPLLRALEAMLPTAGARTLRSAVLGRRVDVHGNLCLDPGRRMRAGDVVRVWDHPLAPPARVEDVRIVFADDHLAVVDKPAGLTSVAGRDADRAGQRRQSQPTLDTLVARLLARPPPSTARGRPPRSGSGRLVLHPVHRIDRDTSGLMVFARSAVARDRLVRMFAEHALERVYLAVVRGRVEAARIESWLVRDRGDGLRGSLPAGVPRGEARRAVTHVRPIEALDGYTVVECRLETGRTHQIRIHLSELGHPLCGEKIYTHAPGERALPDPSGAPRMALHAAELGFAHPIHGRAQRFRSPWPQHLADWLRGLRASARRRD